MGSIDVMLLQQPDDLAVVFWNIGRAVRSWIGLLAISIYLQTIPHYITTALPACLSIAS